MENMDKEIKELNDLLQENLNDDLQRKEKDLFGVERSDIVKNINSLYIKHIKFGESIIIGYILSTIENNDCSIKNLKDSLLNFIGSDSKLNEYVMEIKKIYNKNVYDLFKKE